MLYRLKNVNVKKLALVKNPASGHRFHVLKSAPEPGADAELERWADSLTYDDAEAVLAEIDRLGPTEEQRASEARAALAKEAARRALGVTVAKSGPPADLARLAQRLERQEIVDRQERVLADMRDRPKHATSWLYNRPTGTAEEAADMVMRLKAADPAASRPRWGM
jgi:hypothetical protein